MQPLANRTTSPPIDDGIRYGRRHVLRVAGAFGALPFLHTLSGRGPEHGSLGAQSDAFDAFADAWRDLHVDYMGGGIEGEPMEDAYLYRLAAEARGLAPTAVPPMMRKAFENERLSTGPAWVGGAIFAVVVEMAPDSVLTPHDHPGHVVVTMGLRGTASYAHYELADEPPPKDDRASPFLVRETRTGILAPGCTTHLSRTRDNMHTFRAGPEGATLVDFTTEIGGPKFSMLTLDAEPEDAFEGLYVARWSEVKF